ALGRRDDRSLLDQAAARIEDVSNTAPEDPHAQPGEREFDAIAHRCGHCRSRPKFAAERTSALGMAGWKVEELVPSAPPLAGRAFINWTCSLDNLPAAHRNRGNQGTSGIERKVRAPFFRLRIVPQYGNRIYGRFHAH